MSRFESFIDDNSSVSYETLPVAENATEMACILAWARQNDIPNNKKNAYALAWIIRGMAAKFRDYADEHPEETVGQTEDEIDALLERIDKGSTYH